MKGSPRSRQMIEVVMNNLIDPIKSDLILASRQGTIHFIDLHVLAYLLMGVVEYGYYYLQIHPENDTENVLMRGWDIIFNPVSQYTQLDGEGLKKVPGSKLWSIKTFDKEWDISKK